MKEIPDPYMLAVLLGDAVLVLLLYERLLAALQGGVDCVKGQFRTREYLSSNYVSASARLLFFLLQPFVAVTLQVCGVSRLGFFPTLGLLLLLAIFRLLVCRGLDAWTKRSLFSQTERICEALWVLGSLTALPVLLLGWLAPGVPQPVLRVMLSLVVLFFTFIYVQRGRQIFLTSRFSIFYWVLYLCGLEFLPISAAVNFLMHGN